MWRPGLNSSKWRSNGSRSNRKICMCAALLFWDGPRAPVVTDVHECECRVRHLVAIMRLKALRPRLDMDLHRCAADALHLGVDLQHVADPHRADEGHRLDGERHDPAARTLHARDAARLV